MLRNFLGHSIVILFTLAAFFFSLIFLIGIADNTKTNNAVEAQVPLQQSEISRWGTIPGDLQYVFTRTATIYSFNVFDSTKLNMDIQGPYELITERTFQDPTWVPTKSSIGYSMNYTYEGINESQLATPQSMPNLAGLSVWYQKTHKPTYWKAWQALTQVSNLMFTSNMLSRFYAYNAYEYLFSDQVLVNQGVLASLSAADQITVYTNSKFGMNSVEKLTFWVYANVGGDTSAAWINLVAYYAKQGVDLSVAMYQICGKQSILQMIVQNQYAVVFNYQPFDQRGVLNEHYLIQQQWGQNSLLNNANLMMNNVPTLKSIGAPVFDNVFVAYPEFGSFLENKGMSEYVLNNTQVQLMLNPNTDDYQTLLNPDNMRAFYKQYEDGSYNNVYSRFGFNSKEQTDQFVLYLDYLIEYSLHQGGPLENTAMGELVERTLNQTYATLESTFQLEVTVRNMAQNINSSGGSLSCAYYLKDLVIEQSQADLICATYNFSNVEDLKVFANATWYRNNTVDNYGGDYTDQLMDLTLLNTTSIQTLFDTANPTSFGSYVDFMCAKISTQYVCSNAANCTNKEIASLQWGSSGVTNNPINNDPNYTPKQLTCASWGAWPVYGCDVAVEYNYWQQSGIPLNSIQINRIQNNVVDYYGLLNLYNSMRYMNAYFTENQVMLDKFNSILEIVDPMFPVNLIYMVQGWLLEGPLTTYTTDQLLFGWESSIAAKANGGDYWQGADFNVQPYMTPIFNDQMGPVAGTPLNLYSGSNTLDNVSQMRLLNGQAYLNKITPTWNGTYYTQIPQQPSGALSNANSQYFNGASNGIQFPPSMDQSDLQVFDDRLIQSTTYTYQDTTQIPASRLDINNYQGTWSGGLDCGFTFNMPFYEQSLKCGDCVNTTQEDEQIFQVKIQGRPWTHSQTNSTFNLGAQPDTGFMYYMNKASTMVMLLSYYTNSSQPMQSSEYQPFPMPDLTDLIGIHVPIYDLTQNLKSTQADFLNQLGYVSENAANVRNITIYMVVLAAFFFIAGVIAAIVYKAGTPKDSEAERDSETNRGEQEANESLIR